MKKGLLLSGAIICSLAIVVSSILTINKNHKSLEMMDAAATDRTLTCNNFSSFCTNKYLTTKNGNKINFTISGAKSDKSGLDVGGYFYNTTPFAKVTGILVKYSPTVVAGTMFTEMSVYYSTSTTFSGTQYILDNNSKTTGNCGSANNKYFKVLNRFKSRGEDLDGNYTNIAKTITGFTIYYSC